MSRQQTAKQQRKEQERRATEEAKKAAIKLARMEAALAVEIPANVHAEDARPREDSAPIGDNDGGNHGKKSDPIKWTDSVVAKFTIILAIAQIAQVGLVKCQWDAMKDQLSASSKANGIAQDAIGMARNQAMAAHVPWLNFAGLDFDDSDNRINFLCENLSDSPAMNVVFLADYSSKYPGLSIVKMPETKRTPIYLAPHNKLPQYIGPFADMKIMKTAFLDGKFILKIIVHYDDIFGRHFTMTLSLNGVHGKTNECQITEIVIDGLEQLK